MNDLRQSTAHLPQLEEKLTDFEKLQSDLESRNQEIIALRNQAEDLQQREEAARNELTRMREMESQLQESRDQAAVLESHKAQLESELSESAMALDSARAELAQRDEMTAQLKVALETASTNLQALQQEHQARCEELNTLKVEHTSAIGELDILRIDHKAMAEELEEHKRHTSELVGQMETLSTEKERLQSELSALANDKENQAKIQFELQQKDAQIKSLEDSLSNSDEQRDKLELEVKLLRGQIEGLQYQNQELEGLKEKTARLEAELSEERALIIRLKAQQAAPPPPPLPFTSAEQQPATPLPPKDMPDLSLGFEKARRGQRMRMGEILLESGAITKQQLDKALEVKAKDPRRRIGSILNDFGYASEDVIAAALAAQLRMRFIENIEKELDPSAIQFIAAHLATNHRCVPLTMNAGSLTVAMANPLDLIAIEDIEIASNAQVEPVVATPSKIDAAIARYYRRDAVRTM